MLERDWSDFRPNYTPWCVDKLCRMVAGVEEHTLGRQCYAEGPFPWAHQIAWEQVTSYGFAPYGGAKPAPVEREPTEYPDSYATRRRTDWRTYPLDCDGQAVELPGTVGRWGGSDYPTTTDYPDTMHTKAKLSIARTENHGE